MKKRIAGLVLAASLLVIPVAPAQAQAQPQGGECPACVVGCLVRWTVDFVTWGLQHPGYTCADLN